jgi:hypothetical protein
VLDLFSGYTPILWPVWSKSVWISLEASLRGGSLDLEHSFRVLTEPTRFEHLSSFHAPLLTGEGLIISAVLVLPALMAGISMRKHELGRGAS